MSLIEQAPALPSAADVMAFHDRCLTMPNWPTQALDCTGLSSPELWRLIQANHSCNRRLWIEEDLARRLAVSDAEIVANKRAIDRHNQSRNEAVERIDELLLQLLGTVRRGMAARLSSETPGSMIDRLSILSLKCEAMQLQCARTDVDDGHRSACLLKRDVLQSQRRDLASCLDDLLAGGLQGTVYFKVYRQFKMYNDPVLNPELVKERRGGSPSN